MPRRRLNLFSALLLALCLATCLMWGRSCLRYDYWNWGTASGRAGIDSLHGHLALGWVSVPPAALTTIPRGNQAGSMPINSAVNSLPRPNWSLAGFSATRINVGGYQVREIGIPYWLIFLATGLLPALHLLKRPRTLPGFCRVCGYDLRASPQRCPECGTLAARM